MCCNDKKRILLVEDERITALAESRLLTAHGFDVVTVSTGEDAVETVRSGPSFDLVLMDIDLGKGMDGPQAAAVILENHNLPLVFLSSHTETEIVEKTETITSYGYVVKNSGETVLIASINMAFRLFEAHNRLSESESRYRRVVETSKEGILILDEYFRVTHVNNELLKLFGYEENELIGISIESLLFDDDIEDHGKKVGNRHSGISEMYERRFRRKDGSAIWTIVSANAVSDKNGRFMGSFSMLTDITERKLAEDSLRESEERLAAFMEHIPSLVLIKDSSLRPLFANKLFREYFPADDWIGRTPEELFPSDVAALMREKDMDALQNGYTEYEEEWADRTGKKKSLVTQKFRIDQPGSEPVLGVVITDVTERKAAENLLIEQGRLGQRLGAARSLLEIVDACLDAALRIPGFDCGGLYLVSDRDGSLDLVAHRGLPDSFIEKYSHYESSSQKTEIVMKGKPVYDIVTESMDTVKALSLAVIPVLSRERVVACLNLASRMFDVIPLSSKTALEAIASQMGAAILNARADDRINNERLNFEMLFRGMDDFIFVVDMHGAVLKCNQAVLEKLGYKESELTGESLLKVHPVYMHDEAMKVMADIFAGRRNSCLIPLITRDGRLIPVETRVTRGIWSGRDVVFGVSRDMSEIISMQEALRQSEESYRELFEAESDAIFLIDNGSGSILKANIAACRLYGYDHDELTAMKNTDLSAEESETRRVTETTPVKVENVVYIPLRYHKKKSGDIFPVEITGRFFIHNGKPVHIAAIRDITERKRIEEKLSRALDEKDALLREIQHRVMNNLIMITGLIELESDRAPEAGTKTVLGNLADRVQSLANLYALLHKTGNISSINLDEYFSLIIDSLSGSYLDAARIRIMKRLQNIVIDTKRSAPLGLILNELLTNSLKYAFPCGGEGVVYIDLELDNKNILLRVSDDGVGLDKHFNINESSGFGMMLISMLAAQLGGSILVEEKAGTSFLVTVPAMQP